MSNTALHSRQLMRDYFAQIFERNPRDPVYENLTCNVFMQRIVCISLKLLVALPLGAGGADLHADCGSFKRALPAACDAGGTSQGRDTKSYIGDTSRISAWS